MIASMINNIDGSGLAPRTQPKNPESTQGRVIKMEENMKQRNYPDNRKPNENTTTQKLLKLFTPKELEAIWAKYNGMYKTSEYLSNKLDFYVSPFVVRYLSNKFNFFREIELETSPFYEGVLLGKVPGTYYKHVRLKLEV